MYLRLILLSTLCCVACLRSPIQSSAPESTQSHPEAEAVQNPADRLNLALALADSGQVDQALDSLFLLHQELRILNDSTGVNTKVSLAMVRLLQGAPEDSSEAEGIHSLRYSFDQLDDSVHTELELDSLLLVNQEADSLLGTEVQELLAEAGADTMARYPGIPDTNLASVDHMVKYFTEGKGRRYYRIWLERYAQIGPIIREILREEGLPEDLVFLAMIESGLKLTASSRVKATGPWQFMAGTARVFKLRVDYWMDERRDLELSTRAASRYLRSLYDRYEDWYLAFAAYNWGPGRVNRGIRRNNGLKDYWSLSRMPRETRNYVPTYLAARRVFSELGGDTLSMDGIWQEWASVEVPGALNVERIAGMLDLTEKEFRARNQHIRRFCSPPDGSHVYVPKDKAIDFSSAIAALPQSAYQDWQRYMVRRGDTMSEIAAGYGVGLSQLLKANKMTRRSVIRPGQSLLIPTESGSKQVTRAATADDSGRPMHRVRKGENLDLIARRYGVSVRQLKDWNLIRNANRIYAGQRLVVGKAVRVSKPEAVQVSDSGSTITVKSGDTIGGLSTRYQVPQSQLLALNGLNSRSLIHPGQKLKLPKGSASQTGPTESSSSDNADLIINHYVVRSGDTASGIANRLGIHLSDLIRVNGLDRNAKIFTGQRLKLPRSSEEDRELLHVVRSGDTLWELAKKYKVSVEDIRRWNSLHGSRIRPGRQLVIYVTEEG